MTTRHVGYVVTLENDTREDDAESIVRARTIEFEITGATDGK